MAIGSTGRAGGRTRAGLWRMDLLMLPSLRVKHGRPGPRTDKGDLYRDGANGRPLSVRPSARTASPRPTGPTAGAGRARRRRPTTRATPAATARPAGPAPGRRA